MPELSFFIEGKAARNLSLLGKIFAELGYDYAEYKNGKFVIEKRTESLEGKKTLDYRLEFAKDGIKVLYESSANAKKRSLEIMTILMNVFAVLDGYYLIKPKSIAAKMTTLLEDVGAVLDKDALDLSNQIEDIKLKHADLSKKYESLVRTSEENTRILLECERRRDELQDRVRKLEQLSDDVLKEELFDWVKIHSGSIDVSEFCKSYNVPLERAEEGLQILIKEGYIKRR